MTNIKVGNVTIPIDRWGDGRYWIRWNENGKTHKRPYTTEETAKARARIIATRLANNQPSLTDFTAAEREIYQASNAAALRHGRSLLQAIDEWERDLRARAQPHLAADVLSELMTSKDGHDLHGRYLRGLRDDLAPFIRKHPGDLREVTAFKIETYLASLPVSSRRRNNVLSEIRHLFEFARLRGYLADGITEARKVSMVKTFAGTIGLFTPVEMRLMIKHVEQEWLPMLALAGFSGVRTEEICLAKDAAKRKDPLRWEDFDWDDLEINVRAETSKTGIPRRCPIVPNLYAWISPWRDRHARGPVVVIGRRYDREFGSDGRLLRAINAELQGDLTAPIGKLEWRNDALRHSYGSYRMAVIKNMHQLAYEMGNSVQVIKRNYHNPRSAAAASAWFAIEPEETSGNIIQMPLRLR